MRFRRWQVQIAVALMVLAAAFYAVRWALFPGTAMHDEMLRYLVDDIAFLFIQVLLVSMLVDGLLQRRARDSMLTKLNMIIGAFFSECGTEMLGRLAEADARLADVRADLVANGRWKPQDYDHARRAFREHEPLVDVGVIDLAGLKARLAREKSYLLGLIGNQTLLEHEAFTDLLWAVTHLAEELDVRPDLSALPASDARHIATDVERAYRLLGLQWLDYLQHLQRQYPHLFSLAVRTNPLDPEACATVTE